MGTSLTGKQIKNTYKSLIKVSDNTEASASAKQLSDGNGNDFGVYIDTDGVFGIGSAPSYSLDVSSRTDGVALPVGTTANRPTGFNGLIRYNSTIGKVEFYDTGWKTIYTTSGGTISGDVTVTGDLVVQGTTVTLNTETVQFEDNILMLNRASNDTQYNATNAGIELEKTSAANPSFLYTYSDSTWTATDNFKIEGDLTVDTNTLYVDATNNRVGIGTATPSWDVHIQRSSGAGYALGIYSSDGDELGGFYEDNGNNSEFYLLDSSATVKAVLNSSGNSYLNGGNLGIGTTSPTELLEVDGNIRLGDGAQRNIIGPANNSIGIFANPNSTTEGIIFSTNGGTTTEMFIQDGGNVGIGTDLPDGKLDISMNYGTVWTSSSRANPFLQISNTSSIAGTYSGIELIATGTGSAGAAEIVCIDAGSQNGDLAFSTRNGTWGERMRISSSGNVGIGTDSPSGLLTLKAANDADLLVLQNTAGNTAAKFQISENNGLFITSYEGTTDRYIAFQTGTTERMRIHSGGDISFRDSLAGEAFYWDASAASLSIGAGSAPIDRVHVVGGFTSTGLSVPTNTSIGSVQLGYDGTNGVLRTWNSSPIQLSTYGHIQFDTSGTERMRIGSSGNVIFKGGGAWADNTGNLQLNWTTNEGVISTYYDNHKLTLGSGVSYKNRIEIEGHAAGDGAIKFYTANGASATERMRVTSGGNLELTSGGGILGKSYTPTSTSSPYSITDTGLIPYEGIYEVFLRGNPNSGGSGYYTAVTNGYLHITIDFTSPNIVLEIRFIEVAKTGGGSSDIKLSITPKILLGGTEYDEINYSDQSSAQIRLKVSGYVGTIGTAQNIRIIKKL